MLFIRISTARGTGPMALRQAVNAWLQESLAIHYCNQPVKGDCPVTEIGISHIIIVFIIFLWYKALFPTYPHCVSSWRIYSLKQAFPWICFVSICLYYFNFFLFMKIINMLGL